MGLDCRTLKGMLFLLLLLPSFSAFFWSLAFAAGIVDDAHLLLLPRLCSYYQCICSAAVCCGPGESLLRLELGLLLRTSTTTGRGKDYNRVSTKCLFDPSFGLNFLIQA